MLFFVAGSTLVWIGYLLVARALGQRFVVKVGAVRLPPSTPVPESSPAPTASPMPVEEVPPPEYAQEVAAAYQERAEVVHDEVLRYPVLVMIVVGVVALAFGHLVADRALRPLNRVTETAERLSESTLHERIALRGPNDEVKRLADTFDAMLDRLHRVFDAQRRFIANASHELRTPLAINRTVLEVSLEDPEASPDLKAMARALLATNARYERPIEGLLLLAQSEQEPAVRRAVDLRPDVLSVLDQLDMQPRKRQVTVHRDLAPAVAQGDPLLLERCVYHLLENAVKYNVRGGDVWVTVRAARVRDGAAPGAGAGPGSGSGAHGEGGEVVVTVENTGPLVSPHEVDDLFEPFHRTQGERVRSSRGAGRGLSIVRAIVTVHGGSVEARARPEGGLAVTVRLPST
ncbi:sensor protein CutS [Thermopolyspora flexuosa]|uniref:histidine kinase n=1 Tax=Thermopolyspora flexuosa TaxID=103836 RepID=A0A543IT14_9ACTN|nr:HAMP domain-containing sensor histidine kinase [Thermopolyspora flexuosa]TQM73714.1 signal transduction histidine kinase [Thermopolyspora flexuosa]GGM83547.1 sensor protein CutS [Thermopolyspora flexuosa]